MFEKIENGLAKAADYVFGDDFEKLFIKSLVALVAIEVIGQTVKAICGLF